MHVRTPSGRVLDLGIIATDYDRTLTDEALLPVPAAMRELGRLRAAGVKTVLCTGRARREMPPGPLLSFFDGLILEGGAMLGTPEDPRPVPLPDGWMRQVEAWLQERGITYVSGESYLSVLATHVGELAQLTQEVPASVNLNRDRVDITPPGIDKGSSLRALAKANGWGGDVLAFGDGDNDAHLFAAATYRVAVGNAVEVLKGLADEVAAGYGGHAVAGFLMDLQRVGRPARDASGLGATRHRTRRALKD